MSSDEERRRSSVDSSDLKALEKGITTRVLAERLRTLSELSSEKRDSIPGSSRRLSNSSKSDIEGSKRASIDESSRKPSKFLTGAAIPNSIIKSNLNVKEPEEKDAETLRRERDKRVSEIIEALSPKYKQFNNESRDLEALAKIRKELERRSLMAQDSNEETKSEESEDDTEEALKKAKRKVSYKAGLSPSSNNTKALELLKRDVTKSSSQKIFLSAAELVPQSKIKKTDESSESIKREHSSFITRRKFVSKAVASKNKNNEQSFQILQRGINRPSMVLLENKSLSKPSWNTIDTEIKIYTNPDVDQQSTETM